MEYKLFIHKTDSYFEAGPVRALKQRHKTDEMATNDTKMD